MEDRQKQKIFSGARGLANTGLTKSSLLGEKEDMNKIEGVE